MDRRQFLRALALVSTAVPSACSGCTPAVTQPPRLATPNSIPLAAKRYDRASGTAVFTGCIPLKAGQLFEGDLANVSLWDGTTEIGVTPSVLWPQHVDGSSKIVRICATLTLASGVQRNLMLRLGQARTVSGPAEATIDGAWMKNPRLIGCTDAAHMCASHVAPLPLVPIPHPNLPAQWNTFLTREWDGVTEYTSWGRLRAAVLADQLPGVGGTANYNALSALYYKYMTSGELDRLNDAHHLAQYRGGFPVPMYNMNYCYPGYSYLGNGQYPGSSPLGANACVFYGEAYDGHAAGDVWEGVNPEGWTDWPRQVGQSTEWNSGVYADLFMCYCLSGWLQPRGILVCEGLQKFGWGAASQPFPGAAIQDFIHYGGRFQWRLKRNADLFYALLTPPMALYFKARDAAQYGPIPSPRTERAKFLQWVQKDHFDLYEAWGRTIPAGYVPPNSSFGSSLDFARNSWFAHIQWFVNLKDNPPKWPANFQTQMLWIDCLMAYLNFVKDPRLQAQMVKLGENIYAQLWPLRQMLPYQRGKFGYPLAYTQLGDRQGYGGLSYWSTTQLLVNLTWAWAATGNSKYLDVIDRHCSNTYEAILDGGKAGASGFKELGETYSCAFHAAAYRAGVPWNGWDAP